MTVHGWAIFFLNSTPHDGRIRIEHWDWFKAIGWLFTQTRRNERNIIKSRVKLRALC